MKKADLLESIRLLRSELENVKVRLERLEETRKPQQVEHSNESITTLDISDKEKENTNQSKFPENEIHASAPPEPEQQFEVEVKTPTSVQHDGEAEVVTQMQPTEEDNDNDVFYEVTEMEVSLSPDQQLKFKRAPVLKVRNAPASSTTRISMIPESSSENREWDTSKSKSCSELVSMQDEQDKVDNGELRVMRRRQQQVAEMEATQRKFERERQAREEQFKMMVQERVEQTDRQFGLQWPIIPY